jgi:hypothetical protein
VALKKTMGGANPYNLFVIYMDQYRHAINVGLYLKMSKVRYGDRHKKVTTNTNKRAYFGIFNDNFGHPIRTVIIEHSQQKSFITDGKHTFLKPKDIVSTVVIHIVNIIPFSITHNARSISINKIHVLHNIVSHRKHVCHVRITAIVLFKMWNFSSNALLRY